MGEIWFSGLANLALMFTGRKDVGFSEKLHVRVRLITKDFLFQIFVTNHGTAVEKLFYHRKKKGDPQAALLSNQNGKSTILRTLPQL
jgi:hypothetical protein